MIVATGSSDSQGDSGVMVLSTGSTTVGTAGYVSIATGVAVSGSAGSMSLTVGTTDSGAGADVYVSAGETTDTGSNGRSVSVVSGDGSVSSSGRVTVRSANSRLVTETGRLVFSSGTAAS